MVLVCFVLLSCKENKESKHSVQVGVIVDITDPHSLLPIADPILKLYQFDISKNTEASFEICSLTDKHLNPDIEYHLPEGSITEKNNTGDDPQYREKLVLSFYDKIKQAISSFDSASNVDTSLGHSECFATIAENLRGLNRKKAETNLLIVFSDLQENSEIFNCYPKANQELLQRRPNKVMEIFNNTHLLPDSLKGIKIFFVYEPHNREEDQRFNAIAEIFRVLLESRGAEVRIQANDNNFN